MPVPVCLPRKIWNIESEGDTLLKNQLVCGVFYTGHHTLRLAEMDLGVVFVVVVFFF